MMLGEGFAAEKAGLCRHRRRLVAQEKDDLRDTDGKKQSCSSSGTGLQESACRGRSDCFRKRSHVACHSPWQASRPIPVLHKMGHDYSSGITNRLSAGRQDADYGWETKLEPVEKENLPISSPFAGNPLADINEMERVKFVMKGGLIVRNDF
jgi:hypothetical protein